jgi:hypothetical protein
LEKNVQKSLLIADLLAQILTVNAQREVVFTAQDAEAEISLSFLHFPWVNSMKESEQSFLLNGVQSVVYLIFKRTQTPTRRLIPSKKESEMP